MKKIILLGILAGFTEFTYGMANPASVYCEQNSGTVQIQKDFSGNEYGICVFDDNRICEERAMFNGQCPIGGKKITGYDSNQADIYCAIKGNKAIASDVVGQSGTCILPDSSVCSSQYYFENNSCSGRNMNIDEKAQSLCSMSGINQVQTGMGYIKANFKNKLETIKYYTQNSDGSFFNFDCNLLSSAQIPQLCKDISQMTVNRKNICGENTQTSTTTNTSQLENVILWMNQQGLTKYSDEKSFLPNNLITRQEASKFFGKFAKTEFEMSDDTDVECTFSDTAQADETLKPYILSACKIGIFKGYNKKFLPFDNLSRAQAIAVLMRMKYGVLDESISPWRKNYVDKINELGIIPNTWNANDMEQHITRGELASLIYKMHIQTK